MIKINLLKDKGQETQLNTEVVNIKNFEAGDGSDNILKLLAMIGFALMLYLYQWYNIGNLEEQRDEVTVKLRNIEQQISTKKKEAEAVSGYQKTVEDLNNKLKVVKDFSRTRLRAIKTLDYLQNVVPEKVWLDSISFTGSELIILGYAFADDSLTYFVEKLEKKSDFENVLIAKQEDKVVSGSKAIQFEINSTLKVVDE